MELARHWMVCSQWTVHGCAEVGISHGGTFGAQRDRCLREFDVIFGGTPLPRIRINWDGKVITARLVERMHIHASLLPEHCP